MEKSKFNPEDHFENIKGKKYLPVAWRLVWFREDHPDWSIETEVKDYPEEKRAVSKARISNEQGRVIATGHKTAKPRGMIQDYMELAETGSIGRALAYCGYGTQFAPELEEDEQIVDSPLTSQNALGQKPVTDSTKQSESQSEPILSGKDKVLEVTPRYSETTAGKSAVKAYFGYASQLAIPQEKAKNDVKTKYNLKSFMDISKEQLTAENTRMKKLTSDNQRVDVDEISEAIPNAEFDSYLENK